MFSVDFPTCSERDLSLAAVAPEERHVYRNKRQNQTKLRRSGMKGRHHQILVRLETIELMPPRWGLDFV